MKNTWNLPTVQGHNVHEFIAQLDSQQTPIKTVTVDNTNSYGITVKIYQGTSARGVPYVVIPGRAVTISMDGPSAIFFGFSGPADDDVNNPPNGTPLGNIYLSVSDEEAREGFDGSIASTTGIQIGMPDTPLEVTVENQPSVIVANNQLQAVPIQGTPTGTPISVAPVQIIPLPLQTAQQGPIAITPSPLPISGNVGVNNFPAVVATQITGPFPLQVDAGAASATSPINVVAPPVTYPPAASGNRINYQNSLAITASSPTTPLLLFPQATSGYHCFLLMVQFFGFDRQPSIVWMLQGRNTVGGYVGYIRKQGDLKQSFSGPYFIMPSTTVSQGIFLNIANQNAIIGTLNVFINLMGWFGPT